MNEFVSQMQNFTHIQSEVYFWVFFVSCLLRLAVTHETIIAVCHSEENKKKMICSYLSHVRLAGCGQG